MQPLKIAFDLDETLDHAPILRMMLALHKDQDFNVVVLSGGKTPTERKRRQLQYLGVPDDIELHVAVGPGPKTVSVGKAEWMRDNGFDMLIDDHPMFCSKVREVCPDAVVLQVYGPRVARSHHAIE